MRKTTFFKDEDNFLKTGLFIPSQNEKINMSLYKQKIPINSKKNNVLMNSYIESSKFIKLCDKGKPIYNSMSINYKNFDEFSLFNERNNETKIRLINELSDLQKKLEIKNENKEEEKEIIYYSDSIKCELSFDSIDLEYKCKSLKNSFEKEIEEEQKLRREENKKKKRRKKKKNKLSKSKSQNNSLILPLIQKRNLSNQKRKEKEEEITMEIKKKKKKKKKKLKKKEENYEKEENNDEINNNILSIRSIQKNNSIKKDKNASFTQTNLNILISDNNELEKKLKGLIHQIKYFETQFPNISERYNNEINMKNDIIYSLIEEKKKLLKTLSKLTNDINEKMDKYNKKNIIKNIIKPKKNMNEIFEYDSADEIIFIKDKQIKNVQKEKNIVKKDIQIYKKIKKGNVDFKIHKSFLDEEGNVINNKEEELTYDLKKLVKVIKDLEKENKQLLKIKNYHNNSCIKNYEDLVIKRNILKKEYLFEKEHISYLNDKLKKEEDIQQKPKVEMKRIKKVNYKLNKSRSVLNLSKTNSTNSNSLSNNSMSQRNSFQSFYKKLLSDNHQNESLSQRIMYQNLFKPKERELLANFIPTDILDKYENRFNDIFKEKNQFELYLNNNDLSKNKNKFKNILKKNEAKNTKIIQENIISQNEIRNNNLKIRNLKKKISEIEKNIIEVKEELKLKEIEQDRKKLEIQEQKNLQKMLTKRNQSEKKKKNKTNIEKINYHFDIITKKDNLDYTSNQIEEPLDELIKIKKQKSLPEYKRKK